MERSTQNTHRFIVAIVCYIYRIDFDELSVIWVTVYTNTFCMDEKGRRLL